MLGRTLLQINLLQQASDDRKKRQRAQDLRDNALANNISDAGSFENYVNSIFDDPTEIDDDFGEIPSGIQVKN